MIMQNFPRLAALTGLLGLLSAAPVWAAETPSDDAALIAKGAYLARAGDCVACHTAPGGRPFAGGLALESDLGKIYSSNITPDKDHGIGAYTEAQFAKAMRGGVLPNGTHLYPAMPYPAYAKVTDEDVHALYTYLMKGVAPVAMDPPETKLPFPFSQRWGLALWNVVFTETGPFKPDPKASAEVNRGAYLVEGLAHCGTCHTPRGFAMQEKAFDASSSTYLAGGELNGWHVPSLRSPNPAGKGFATWSVDEMVDYLGSGRNVHTSVGGEMTEVVDKSLGHLNDSDLHAIAVYLKSKLVSGGSTGKPNAAQAAKATTDKLTKAVNLTEGERLYLDNCGACHFVTGQGAARVFPALDGSSLVNAENPNGLLAVMLGGTMTPSTPRSPSILPMPGFAKRLSDQDVATLASFVRSAWGNQAPAVTAAQVAGVRAKLVENGKIAAATK